MAVGKMIFLISKFEKTYPLCSDTDENFSYIDGQSDSVVQDIENMVRSYVQKVFYAANFH